MPPFDLPMPFIVATAVFACIPGPGMLFMSVQTMVRGRRAGWMSALGFHLGGYPHILAAAFGVALLLETLPVLFLLLKLAGAAYLVRLGVTMILGAPSGRALIGRSPRRSARQAFRDGFMVELLNPKTALFFLAFLPPFASPDAGSPVWLQILVLGAIANVAFSATDVLCILVSDRLAALAAAWRGAARAGRRVGGGLVVAMGVHVALRD